MEKVYKVETTLSHSLAELYASLEEEFANKSSIPLSDMNRTLLQTGLIHHLTMMSGLGLIEPEKAAKLQALIDQVAKDTILWDILQMVRTYWRDCGSGGPGSSGGLNACCGVITRCMDCSSGRCVVDNPRGHKYYTTHFSDLFTRLLKRADDLL